MGKSLLTRKRAFIALLMALLSPFALSLAGCGKSQGQDLDNGPKAPIGNIKVDSNVKTIHRDYLAQSLNYLDSLSAWGSQSDLSSIAGINNISSQSLHQWLEDRVQYILASNFDPTQPGSGFYSNEPFIFENPGIFPIIDSGSRTNDTRASDSTPQLMMQNLGAEVYYSGKHQNRLIGLNIPGSGTVLVTSPLVGVVQLGAALFPDGPLAPSVAAYIFLLSTLFHEAHHSDGNGTSLGFFHAVCPQGHPYAGYSACDRNLNGPYKLEAIFEKSLIGFCTRCSIKQTEFLNGQVVDNLSRFLPTSTVNGKTVPSTTWDSTPEGHR